MAIRLAVKENRLSNPALVTPAMCEDYLGWQRGEMKNAVELVYRLNAVKLPPLEGEGN